MLPREEREKRLKALLTAIMEYHGGAKLSNFFTKVYPEVMMLVKLKRKIPVVGDSLRVKEGYIDGKMIIDVERIREAIETFSDNVEEAYIGLFKSKFANVDELEGTFENLEKVRIVSMKELRKVIEEISLGE